MFLGDFFKMSENRDETMVVLNEALVADEEVIF